MSFHIFYKETFFNKNVKKMICHQIVSTRSKLDFHDATRSSQLGPNFAVFVFVVVVPTCPHSYPYYRAPYTRIMRALCFQSAGRTVNMTSAPHYARPAAPHYPRQLNHQKIPSEPSAAVDHVQFLVASSSSLSSVATKRGFFSQQML